MYKIFSYFLILFSCSVFKPTQATCFIEIWDDSNPRPIKRSITQQETHDTYEILYYALTSSVTDLSLKVDTQPQHVKIMPDISEKEVTGDPIVLPKELIMPIIKEADWTGLTILSQTSHTVASDVFQHRTDIYNIHIPPDKNLMKAHLKLMLRASRYPVYAFLTYLPLASYMSFMPIEKADLHIDIASKVLLPSYIEKMKVYCERSQNKEYPLYSFWRAYTDAAQMRLLLLSYIQCVSRKLPYYYIETAIRLVRHTQVIGVKLGHPFDTTESYIVNNDTQTKEIILLAKQRRDFLLTEDVQEAYELAVTPATNIVPIPGMEVIFNIRRKSDPIVLTVLPHEIENK
jgi:hypothetical protein